MSHELRTPLNAMIGSSEMLQEEASEIHAEPLVSDLQKIRAAAKHQLGLINDILDLSKIEAGKITLSIEELRNDRGPAHGGEPSGQRHELYGRASNGTFRGHGLEGNSFPRLPNRAGRST